jgi:hypothetical protein
MFNLPDKEHLQVRYTCRISLVQAVKAYGGVQRVSTFLNLAHWMTANGQLDAPTAMEKQAIVTWKQQA